MSTDRRQRALSAPDPARVPVDERRPEDDMVFAAAYAAHLKFYGADDKAAGTWQEFFSSDVSAQLAVVAIEDVDRFRARLKAALRTVEDPEPSSGAAELGAALGEVFDLLGTLAARLDHVLAELPSDQPLRATLANLVRTRLSPMLRSLVGYHRAGVDLGVLDPAPPAGVSDGLSAPEWPAGVGVADWAAYIDVDPADYLGAYGESTLTDVERLNHLATHNLFTAINEAFLAVFARVVAEAGKGVEATYGWNGHQPHYALFLAFLRLLQHARDETNTISARHLAYYYHEVLRLGKRPAVPDHAHVLVELAKNVDAHLLPAGTLLKAGKDDAGRDRHVALDDDLAANRAAVTDLRHLHRATDGRILAGPVTEGEDGSWHPFVATEPAEVGFAFASDHLLLAEGQRRVEVRLEVTGLDDAAALPVDLHCELTTAEGWLARDVATATVEDGMLTFGLELDGTDPPIRAYDPAVHDRGFATSQPVLLVTLRHREDAVWSYDRLSAATITAARLEVSAEGLTSLALSNDHGPIDPSKPFLAFGSAPLPNSSLVIGSSEVFAKSPSEVELTLELMTPPVAHKTTPTLSVDELDGEPIAFPTTDDPLVITLTDPGPGNVRLVLSEGFGTDRYPIDLAVAIMAKTTPPAPPVLPTVRSLTLDYTADQELDHFFHVGPSGHAEQSLDGETAIPLLPRFEAGELLLGVGDLHPPQNLALLFQVVDGTANPSVPKPADHLHWSYLRGNTWVDLEKAAVTDGSTGLLASGIVTLAMPADADTEHTLLPAGLHWIRAAVASSVDAVCRLRTVAAQALRATSVLGDDDGPAPQGLPAGTITKPDPPDPAVKKLAQPYDGFGGRPVETDADFATRVSERLRHKDRAIASWDYERLVLEAFPSIHRVRCLAHTRYVPDDSGVGAYSEEAPGHVTVVTVPDLGMPDPHDPLRPRTSLRVLDEIEDFLARRMSCFATLHVRNPQFEEVRVDLNVRFREGADETLSKRRVQEEITRFLSPWAFRGDAPPSFGGTVHKSVLVDMIEELPWVDYLTDVQLHHLVPGIVGAGQDLERVTASRAVAILVSVPAEQHGVHPIPAGAEALPADCGCARCGEGVRP